MYLLSNCKDTKLNSFLYCLCCPNVSLLPDVDSAFKTTSQLLKGHSFVKCSDVYERRKFMSERPGYKV